MAMPTPPITQVRLAIPSFSLVCSPQRGHLGDCGALRAARAARDVDVKVLSASDRFLFNPSLLSVLFRKRTPEEITFSRPTTCFGAAYEYLFSMAFQLRKAGLKKQVKLTYVTSEPFT